jgi:hypothetical protein
VVKHGAYGIGFGAKCTAIKPGAEHRNIYSKGTPDETSGAEHRNHEMICNNPWISVQFREICG